MEFSAFRFTREDLIDVGVQEDTLQDEGEGSKCGETSHGDVSGSERQCNYSSSTTS